MRRNFGNREFPHKAWNVFLFFLGAFQALSAAAGPLGAFTVSGPVTGASCCPDAGSIVSTFAGNGTAGYSGDGGPASAALLYFPSSVAVDPAGNIYFIDLGNLVVRRIDTAGTITTVAGNGTSGYSGDGGPATLAQFMDPASLAVDAAGNLYISDLTAAVVRKVNASGIISTIAGNGTAGYTGDGGPATSAELNPTWLLVDPFGNLLICDQYYSVIRKVNPAGVISTFAGVGSPGYFGDGGPATQAYLYTPEAMAYDPGSASLYFWDDLNYHLRKINSCGIISTVAGNGTKGDTGDGGPATLAELSDIHGMALCHGDLYLSDWPSNSIRMINSCGVISTIGGNNTQGDTGDGGPFSAATMNVPQEIAIDASGNLYIAESQGNRIRKVAPDCSPTPTPACALPPTATPACTQPPAPAATPTPTLSPTPPPAPTATSTPTCQPRLWPNPFNPDHAVNGTLKVDCLPPQAVVSFYTLSGELVRSLDGNGGLAQWDGRNQVGARAAPGIYFYAIQQGSQTVGTGKLLVTR